MNKNIFMLLFLLLLIVSNIFCENETSYKDKDYSPYCKYIDSSYFNIPKDVKFNNPKQIIITNYTICVLDDDGVRCWGDGKTYVPDFIKPKMISAGFGYICALFENDVNCWNRDGDVYPNMPKFNNPTYISGFGPMNCVIANGEIQCWGDDFGFEKLHSQLSKLSNVSKITLGQPTCVLFNDKSVKCYDYDLYVWEYKSSATQVPLLENPIDIITSTSDFACAIVDTGIKCWGKNTFCVTNVPILDNPFTMDTAKIAGDSVCAIDNSGIKCWGENACNIRNIPIISKPTALAAGDDFACAASNDGIKCWGFYYYE